MTSYTFSGIAWDVTDEVEVSAPNGQSMLPVHDTQNIIAALVKGTLAGSTLTSVTSSDGTVAYTYDAIGQLLSADYTGGSI